MSLLKVENIVKRFGTNTVLNGVSFNVEKGDVKVIIGPSGTGKSTMLRCINMLNPPEEGQIFLQDKDLTAKHINLSLERQKIGMVFQHFALFKHLKALDNVALGLRKVRKMSKNQAYEKAEQELSRVGLFEHRFKFPAELSGGQQQRVGIARALAMDPLLMLFDEPTSALDPELIGEVLTVMQKLAKEGMTMICVTHEMGFAKSVASEIIFMEGGKILEQSEPAIMFKQPKHERTRIFLNKISELYGEH
ncbi:MAG: amino acid ABC transporter ATP-binding protein [Candidatus Delongbacteria bacterium]|nr:amino acid ABC transporter ATP-binding protein [Candidatus Delongbacteria bacterium]MBN2836931.1 amino acid ABC transporter ATP-binding protein [Candidatus Delongbacteria bacterium]